MGAAEAGHAAAGDASKHRLVGANADTNGGEEGDEQNCTHAGVNVRPARSCLLAVSVTVLENVSSQFSSFRGIAVGRTAASIISDVVNIG